MKGEIKMKFQLKTVGVLILFGLFSMLFMGMTQSSVASADVRGPIRPTVEPTATPTTTPAETSSQVTGGLIVLQATADSGSTAGLWTRVEWQDPNTKKWHLVEGWQGEFDGDKRITWYVARQNLNEQLFRWVVYRDESQTERLATSDPFDLPTAAMQTVTVEIDW